MRRLQSSCTRSWRSARACSPPAGRSLWTLSSEDHSILCTLFDKALALGMHCGSVCPHDTRVVCWFSVLLMEGRTCLHREAMAVMPCCTQSIPCQYGSTASLGCPPSCVCLVNESHLHFFLGLCCVGSSGWMVTSWVALTSIDLLGSKCDLTASYGL